MASISSTSSLGNTSLRGYGGMASGIDRDAIIEKMTLGTTTKISNQKGKITQLQWKQEAYRNITDQILDLSDKYTSYSSTSSLKDASIFAKNVISVHGKEEATRFVTARGTSDLIDNLSITGVQNLATSAVRQSGDRTSTAINTRIKDLSTNCYSSLLEGSKLTFGIPVGTGDDMRLQELKTFTFPSSYTDENGKKQQISYIPPDNATDAEKEKFYTDLAEKLTKALEESGIDFAEFRYEKADPSNGIAGKLYLDGTKPDSGYEISSSSSVLSALGYQKNSLQTSDKSINFTALVCGIKSNADSFDTTSVHRSSALEYLKGKKVTFTYDGVQKDIELLTAEDAEKIKDLPANEQFAKMGELLQNRLERAFGKNTIAVDTTNGLSFNVAKATSSLSITSNNSELLMNLGIANGESTKVNLNGKLNQSALNLGDDLEQYLDENGSLNLVINGAKIEGLTKDSTINDIISKINSTSAAGVKATYVDATGQFMLVASETGKGREITFGYDGTENDADGSANLANALFGGGVSEDGTNAVIHVSYGGGNPITLERTSNSFNLEGINITVSGVFGGDWTEVAGKPVGANDSDYKQVDGKWMKWTSDASETVTFTAKADVDAAVERVKSFFEDFNALATDINKEITTRPDSSYGPLTDEQKDEMDETSIKNWEDKAKQGILYGDSAMRDLSVDVQGIFLKLMENGASYEELKEMGITYSEDWGDGGTIVFDESKFRSAMESDPEKVSNIFTGGGGVSKGLMDIVDETFTPYATRYASKNATDGGKGSYGRLIEIAGTEKKPTTLMNNEIYNQIKDLNTLIEQLQEKLKKEQDRYISQFTTMESLINQMNTQSSYLSQITG